MNVSNWLSSFAAHDKVARGLFPSPWCMCSAALGTGFARSMDGGGPLALEAMGLSLFTAVADTGGGGPVAFDIDGAIARRRRRRRRHQRLWQK